MYNYYGAINEKRALQGVEVEIPPKPQALIYAEQREEFGALPYAGGFLDQPYILMLEMQRASDIRSIFLNLERQQAQQLAQQASNGA